jgi:hypothetical protein
MNGVAYWETTDWWFNESYDGFYHCGRASYWEGESVYCSKCQDELTDNSVVTKERQVTNV